jgi:hypothetical protein
MFKGYAELTALEPKEYLNWEQFDTFFDDAPFPLDADYIQAYAQEQYQHGLDIGKASHQVHISANGTWGATQPSKFGDNVSHVSSSEGIGYHACTKDLLHGFIDSGVEIVVYRYSQNEPTKIQ